MERRIELEGQDNFRDLGGYATRCGRRVRPGVLFRSGELIELSDGDLQSLSALGIRTVIDLRGVEEAERKGPDRLPDGASLVRLPIEPGDLSALLGKALMADELDALPPDLLEQINRAYVRDWGAEFAELLRIAADPERRPIVFHCTQGKDRAGISAAVLLSALGVPWETVLDDYLLSNTLRAAQAEAGLASMRRSLARRRRVDPETVDASTVRGLFFVDAAYLEAARDEMVQRHGSVDGFLREGVGVTDEALAALRDALLESE